MSRRPMQLHRWIRQQVHARLLSLTVALALLAGFVFGWATFISELRHDESLLRSIRFHTATLLETQDRPELLRLIRSVSENENVEIWVTQGDHLVASSTNPQMMDRPYAISDAGLSFFGVRLAVTGAETSIPIVRPGGTELHAKLYLKRPTIHLLFPVIWIIGAAFLFCFGIIRITLRMVDRATMQALAPLERFERAIRSLKTFGQAEIGGPSGIFELETIRAAILESQAELEVARDRLADSKARTMTAEAYRQLIHDLHTPVCALRRLVKIVGDGQSAPSVRDEVSARISRLADQIIKQVGAAKAHLSLPAAEFSDSDLSTTLAEATEIAKLASTRVDQVTVVTQIPINPVKRAHDVGLFRRAIMNLVGNALDACRANVLVKLDERADGRLSISVSDDGPGASPEDVSLWLQGRGQSSKADRVGLGLATANHIARTHGGRILYRPSEFGGACFEMRIEASNGS